MSELVPAPAIEAHYFATPAGHVCEVVYTFDATPTAGAWRLHVMGGLLKVDLDTRASVIAEATNYAREAWPERGGSVAIDHKGLIS